MIANIIRQGWEALDNSRHTERRISPSEAPFNENEALIVGHLPWCHDLGHEGGCVIDGRRAYVLNYLWSELEVHDLLAETTR